MPKNNIILIVSPGSIGGAERYIEDLALDLKSKGYFIKILISHNKEYSKELETKFPKHVQYIGNNLWKIFCNKSGVKYVERNSTIISSGYHSLFVAMLLKFWLPFKGINHVDIKHGWVKNDRFQKIMTSIDKILSRFCDFVVVVNSKMKSELGIITSKVIHIQTGIRQSSDLAISQQKQNIVRLGLVGRIEPEKRFNIGLRIANKVAEKHPTEIHIIGDGSLKGELLNTDFHKNLKRIFYGHVSRDQVPYNNFDILLITSTTEGSPLVALEAMSLGKYVISTNVGNLTEILNNQRGCVIDESNCKKLIDKMSTEILHYYNLDQHAKIELSKKTREYIDKYHSLDVMTNNYIKII